MLVLARFFKISDKFLVFLSIVIMSKKLPFIILFYSIIKVEFVW